MVPEGQEDDICVPVTINSDNVIESIELFQLIPTSSDVAFCSSDITGFISITDSTSK